jgi:hypothetical protein
MYREIGSMTSMYDMPIWSRRAEKMPPVPSFMNRTRYGKPPSEQSIVPEPIGAHKPSQPLNVPKTAYTSGNDKSHSTIQKQLPPLSRSQTLPLHQPRPMPRLAERLTENRKSLSSVPTTETPSPDVSHAKGRPRVQSMDSTASTLACWESLSSSLPGTLGPNKYQYQPLEQSEIRLVKVHPERMWKLKCDIIYVSLENAPKYRAISVSRTHYQLANQC